MGRKPFDVAGIRKMREMQVRQLVKPGTVNAKFSPGALVDVEYFVQGMQIGKVLRTRGYGRRTRWWVWRRFERREAM